jgi:hypothetical protein
MKQILNGKEWNFCHHCREYSAVDYESNGKSYCKQCCLHAMKNNEWFIARYMAYNKKDNK